MYCRFECSVRMPLCITIKMSSGKNWSAPTSTPTTERAAPICVELEEAPASLDDDDDDDDCCW